MPLLRSAGPSDWPNGRPPSVLVLPMEIPSTSAEELDIAVSVAEDVSAELGYWEGVRAVPSVSVVGPMFDRGIRGPAITRLEDAILLARDLAVAAVVTITVEVRGDSARAQASLFDAASGSLRRRLRPIGPTVDAVAPTGALAEPIARRVLGLQDQPFAPLAAQRLRSRSPDALVQEDAGRRQMERWRLTEAERSFRRAIELDSTFALAHHRLAQTLYWRSVQDPYGRPNSAQEVARSSAVALRFADGLPRFDQAHISAFHSFQEGDYEAARRAYVALLEENQTDVYAWLMLGSVEFADPWLSDTVTSATPRGNWNRAVEAFVQAVELQPTFELGYGHIFDIYRAVASSTNAELCRGFEVPRDARIPPWERPTPDNQRLFCLVAQDTIAWVPPSALASVDLQAARPSATALLAEATRLLVRWSLYAPDLPEPLYELAELTVAQYSRLVVAPPRVLDSLAARAVGYQSRALALVADTLPPDLFRLATYQLAARRLDDALTSTEAGLDRHQAVAPLGELPPEAVNAFVAAGQPERALALLSEPLFRRFEPDTALGRFVPYGGAEAHLQRARLLGAAMVSGQPLREEIRAILALWSSPEYTDRDRELLRRSITPDLLLALAFDEQALDEWGPVQGLDDPLWDALLALAREDGRAATLADGALTNDQPRSGDLTRTFVKGALALRLGRADTALRLLNRVDSIPLRLEGFEPRWAIRGSSLFLKGEASLTQGDTALAMGNYERFLAQWSSGDPLIEPAIALARQRVLELP
ncbi:MAG TPA: hypothetical protein VMM35_08025 [Longimicrobiales bacterium]|nr:hypothetical protein [Longimicrobiales bacterium]